MVAAMASLTHRVTRHDASIPYQTTSMTVISTVAILAPLSIFVLSILLATQRHQQNNALDQLQENMRNLQQDCINATATNDQTLEITWTAVKLTSTVASSVAALCAIGYEFFRRDPIIGKYVYDRKRLKEPDRTPPPLMLSRSLWSGWDNDTADNCGSGGKKKKMTCWKVKPSILELLFINLDHKYVRYSKAADEARKKREERGQFTCCRTGWYHKNCCFCKKRKLKNARNDELFVDEDGYEYYPGHDYTLDEEVIAKRFEVQWSKTIDDLFPAERVGDSIGGVEETIGTGNTNDAPEFHSFRAEEDLNVRSDSTGEIEEFFDTYANEQDSTEADPESLAFRDEVGSNVGDSEIEETTDSNINEQDNIDADPESLELRAAEETFSNGSKSSGGVDLNCDESRKTKKMSYPYRLVYLFMPPGFHVWSDALPYMSHFFWAPAIVRRFNILFRRTATACDDHDDDISLTEPEKELLHFVGLDIYLLIRFARFGFDVTYYPFLVACVAVLPVYYSAAEGSSRNNYLSNTINGIENGSRLIWVVLVFSVVFFLYVLRRLWIEWEVFIQLRHQFLACGTRHFYHNNSIQRKYQKTCIVECVPDECRTDVALFDTFNKLFPNQIERAEMLAETSKLEALVGERTNLIVQYENAESLHRYRCWKNTKTKLDEPKVRGTVKSLMSCFQVLLNVFQIRTGRLCFGKKKRMKAYYESEILEVNQLLDKEYSAIVAKRASNVGKAKCQQEGKVDPGFFSINTLYRLFPSHVRALISLDQFSSSCGIVEFKTFAAKQWAVQCNLADQPYWMITNDAPDPRDIIWSNMCMDYQTIEYRERVSEFILLIGLACWGYVVTLITSFSNVVATGIGLAQVDYLKGLLVFLVLLWLPAVFLWFADRVIRFKSMSKVDEFVMKWSTGYRIANIFFVLFNVNLIDSVQCFSANPQAIWIVLSNGIVRQSAFLMNLVIQAAGQETMLQLLQWRSLIKQAVKRPLTNVNSKSRRYLDTLKEPPLYERSFVFGFYAPTLSYCLMIGMMFGFICPLMLGVCAMYFWIASKINTHNALFVYRQPFESGGTRFYYWSRMTLVSCYASIAIFAGMLAIKSFAKLAIFFLLVMIFIVYLVDKAITRRFVVHSLELPLKVVAEEEVSLISEPRNTAQDDEAIFMYRNPILQQKTWQ